VKTFLIWVISLLVLFPVAIDLTQTETSTQSVLSVPNTFVKRELSFDKRVTEEINCLAINMYHEARGEPHIGKLAVAFVTINRVKSGQFPSSICEVVKQRNGNVCQFTWYCTKNTLTTVDNVLYNEMKQIATYIYTFYDELDDPSNGALYYHSTSVRPRWKKLIRTVMIGKHIFYTEKV